MNKDADYYNDFGHVLMHMVKIALVPIVVIGEIIVTVQGYIVIGICTLLIVGIICYLGNIIRHAAGGTLKDKTNLVPENNIWAQWAALAVLFGLTGFFAIIYWYLPANEFKGHLANQYFWYDFYASLSVMVTEGFQKLEPIGAWAMFFEMIQMCTVTLFVVVVFGIFTSRIANH